MNTFEAQLTQFMRPNGTSKSVTTTLPIEVEPLYKSMLAAGCRLEAEVLTTDEVSVTVSNVVSEVDIDFSVTQNGPDVQSGIVAMLRRESWNTHVGEGIGRMTTPRLTTDETEQLVFAVSEIMDATRNALTSRDVRQLVGEPFANFSNALRDYVAKCIINHRSNQKDSDE